MSRIWLGATITLNHSRKIIHNKTRDHFGSSSARTNGSHILILGSMKKKGSFFSALDYSNEYYLRTITTQSS